MSTVIIIPGRETQTIPGLTLTTADVVASFAGDINLSSMDSTESEVDGVTTVAFSNRTGTKGNTDLLEAMFAEFALQQNTPEVTPEVEVEEEEEFDEFDEPEVINTLIVIPGREDQLVRGIVLDSQMVRESFSGDIDLSSYDVEETELGDTLQVAFQARTGTKGA